MFYNVLYKFVHAKHIAWTTECCIEQPKRQMMFEKTHNPKYKNIGSIYNYIKWNMSNANFGANIVVYESTYRYKRSRVCISVAISFEKYPSYVISFLKQMYIFFAFLNYGNTSLHSDRIHPWLQALAIGKINIGMVRERKKKHAKDYNDVIMSTIASQITSLTIIFSNVYSHADQRKHQGSASLVFVRVIHRGRGK